MKKRKLPKNIMCVAIVAIIIGCLTLICASGQIAYEVADNFECWRPDYEMQKDELLRIMDKSELSKEDYTFLYEQTGLTKIGIDRARERGANGTRRVSAIQDDYFKEHTVVHHTFSPYICFCRIGDRISNIYLEEGDIVVNSSTNLLGWRMGHSGLVTYANGADAEVLQAAAIGTVSAIGNIADFTDKITFMVLSPKVEKDKKKEVVNYAAKNLLGIPYNPLRGIFSPKDKIDDTQCAHLVWYAYHKFGIDIDGNGGGLVTPQDFANSSNMEVVQVFGFNPTTLWK